MVLKHFSVIIWYAHCQSVSGTVGSLCNCGLASWRVSCFLTQHRLFSAHLKLEDRRTVYNSVINVDYQNQDL